MGIMDDYKQLQMIENIKKIKEMELCYKSNLKLCKKQEQQINKLATCVEKINKIVEENKDTAQYRGICLSILQKISECEGNNEN